LPESYIFEFSVGGNLDGVNAIAARRCPLANC
jgi:hypothetical protein